jgi:hypothetical protein
MNCCRNNLSMTSTRKINASMYLDFMDTFTERVHAVGMKEQTQANRIPYPTNKTENIGYGV